MIKKSLFSQKGGLPEIIEIEIEHEISGFEHVVLERLLDSFNSIEEEAQEHRRHFLEQKNRNFDPDRDDEGVIAEDAYFLKLNHIVMEEKLKQEFLNYSVVWLNHIFEEQKNRIFGEINQDEIQKELAETYNLGSCTHWKITNGKMRNLANIIKHGFDGRSGEYIIENYPEFIVESSLEKKIVISKQDIKIFIDNLKEFWQKILADKVVKSVYDEE